MDKGKEPATSGASASDLEIDDKYLWLSYGKIKKELNAASVDCTTALDVVENILQDMIGENPTTSEKHQQYIFDNGLPDIINILVNKRLKDREQEFLRVHKFFRCCIDLALKYLKHDVLSLLSVLNKILDDNKYINFTMPDHVWALFITDVGEMPQLATTQLRKSRFLLYNINYLIVQGFLDLSLERMESGPGAVPMLPLKEIIITWSKICQYLSSDLKKKYLQRFQDVVISMMLNLDDSELRPVKKSDVSEIVKYLGEIIGQFNKADVHKICESFCLDFALKCFRSSNLEKRMQGLSYMEEAIDMTRRSSYTGFSGMSSTSTTSWRNSPSVAKWMNTKFLLKWIQEHEIVETLFDPKSDPHRELIKHSKDILKFLNTEGALTTELLDQIWNVSNSDQVTSDAIFELFESLCVTFKEPVQLYLLDKAKQLDPSRYSPSLVKLCVSMHHIKIAFLDFLWQIIQDDSHADQKIVDHALQVIMDKCEHYGLKHHFDRLIEMGVEGIRARSSVLQSINLLFKIMGNTKHFPDEKEEKARKANGGTTYTRSSNTKTRQDFINEVCKKYSLLDELITEFCEYRKVSNQVIQDKKLEGKEDIGDMIFTGRYPHNRQIGDRLHFLEFLLGNSSAKLSVQMADMLWEAFMENPLATAGERRSCLIWFHSISRELDNEILDEEVSTHIFEKLSDLVSVDPVGVTDVAFEAFSCYMLAVNAHRKNVKIIRTQIPFRPNFEIVSLEGLVGMDCLWKIVTNAKDPKVSYTSTEFLVKFYQNIDREVLSINEIQAAYVDTCMSQLKESKAALALQGDNKAIATQIDRLVSMLKTFLDESTRREEERKKKKDEEMRKSLEEKRKKEEMKLAREKEEKERKELGKKPMTPKTPPAIKKGKEEEVQNLMDMMAVSKIVAILAMKETNWQMNNAINNLFRDATKSRYEKEAQQYETFSDSGEEEKEEMVEMEETETGGEVAPEPEGEVELSPSTFVANKSEYFDLLFELLNISAINRGRVWDILDQLPINARLLEIFQSLKGDNIINESAGKPHWEILLDSRSIYKMLYSLKIIDSLMVPTPDDDEKKMMVKEEWCKKFFYSYGFHHLYKKICSGEFENIDQQSDAFRKCLKLLLKIVHYFMKGGLQDKEVADIPMAPFATPSLPPDVVIGPQPADQQEQEKEKRRRELTLSVTTGQKLINSVDFELFVRRLISITWSTCKGFNRHNANQDIVKYAMSLLNVSIASRPDLLNHFYHYPNEVSETGEVLHSNEQKPTIDDFIISVVMEHHDQKIRQAATNGFYLLATRLTKLDEEYEVPRDPVSGLLPDRYFLDLLLRHIPGETSTSYTCEEYFKFLTLLISEYFQSNKDNPNAFDKFRDLLYTLINYIKNRPIFEGRDSYASDSVLIGWMDTVRTLIHENVSLKEEIGGADGLDMINLLWFECLFPRPEKLNRDIGIQWIENAKCKTSKSRDRALKLLVEFAKDCESNTIQLFNLLFTIHEKGKEPLEIERPSEKNYSGYIGLKNPGCICYMNSLLQQIYMTPALRYGLMACPIPEIEELTTNELDFKKKLAVQKEIDENVVYQLQRMFGYFMHSEKQYYDPSNTFLKAFKDRSGEMINLMRQEDASEFLYSLTDRLETKLKGTPYEKLHQHYTGIESQIVRCCKNPQHFSASEHPVSLITVPVKDQENLNNALSTYILAEQLDDWKCDQCDAVSGATKQICYKTLSNLLIIHLKRFDYRLTATGDIVQYKIQDRFEFPHTVDMEPFTLEGIARMQAMKEDREAKLQELPEGSEIDEEELQRSLEANHPKLNPDSYYQYELVGILIHSGRAEAGHYYSFIKDRTMTEQKWYEFNDSVVQPWNIDLRLEAETFGGGDITKSAYMLFYQRIKPEPEDIPLPPALLPPPKVDDNMGEAMDIEVPEGKGKEKEDAEKPEEKTATEKPKQPEKDELHKLFVTLPSDFVLNQVWEENHEVLRHRRMFEDEYMSFLSNALEIVHIKEPILELPEKDGELEFYFRIIRFATYLMDTLVRSGKNERKEEIYKDYVKTLQNLYSMHVPAAKWFLNALRDTHKQKWLRYHLIDCTYPFVRDGFCDLIVVCLKTVGETEYDIIRSEMEQLNEMRVTEGKVVDYTPIVWEYKSAAVSIEFINYLASISESTRSAWRRFQSYWTVFKKYSEIGPVERQWLVFRYFIWQLVDFYMGYYTPYKEKSSVGSAKRRVSIGGGSEKLRLEAFLDTLANLCCVVRTQGMKNSGKYPETIFEGDVEFMEMDIHSDCLMFNRGFYDSILRQAYNVQANVRISEHFSFEDLEKTKFITERVLETVAKGDYIQTMTPVVERLLSINDSFTSWRINRILSFKGNGVLAKLTSYSRVTSSPMFILTVLNFFATLFKTNPYVAQYLYENKSRWWPTVMEFFKKDHDFNKYTWKDIPEPQQRITDTKKTLEEIFAKIEEGSEEYVLKELEEVMDTGEEKQKEKDSDDETAMDVESLEQKEEDTEEMDMEIQDDNDSN
eukprot:CAMPEP_0174268074 /NCGR_PEP_ID=MMETSP0439-20130205/36039_1 /TAXON_ID=0 /ORGANISM="Stereomyxa ramosa, Strain Chinc5" /LENGTH=2490 /DNA_ID=CAMNT_0015356015 /DNA_START=82 /DNA_END=7554 /DNA_ORIENTATION=+